MEFIYSETSSMNNEETTSFILPLSRVERHEKKNPFTNFTEDSDATPKSSIALRKPSTQDLKDALYEAKLKTRKDRIVSDSNLFLKKSVTIEEELNCKEQESEERVTIEVYQTSLTPELKANFQQIKLIKKIDDKWFKD